MSENVLFRLDSCKDSYPRCDLVVQADMCKHEGYRNVCCESCALRGYISS